MAGTKRAVTDDGGSKKRLRTDFIGFVEDSASKSAISMMQATSDACTRIIKQEDPYPILEHLILQIDWSSSTSTLTGSWLVVKTWLRLLGEYPQSDPTKCLEVITLDAMSRIRAEDSVESNFLLMCLLYLEATTARAPLHVVNVLLPITPICTFFHYHFQNGYRRPPVCTANFTRLLAQIVNNQCHPEKSKAIVEFYFQHIPNMHNFAIKFEVQHCGGFRNTYVYVLHTIILDLIRLADRADYVEYFIHQVLLHDPSLRIIMLEESYHNYDNRRACNEEKMTVPDMLHRSGYGSLVQLIQKPVKSATDGQ